MKVLHRYIIKEQVGPFLLSFVVFTFIFFMGTVLKEMADKIINKGLPVLGVLHMLVYLIPPLLVYTLPMAVLLSTLIAFGRLSSDSEIVAVRASGFSPMTLFKPVIVLSAILCVLLTFLAAQVAPRSERKTKTLLARMALAQPMALLKEQFWIQEFEGMKVFIERIDNRQKKLSDVTVFLQGEQAGKNRLIMARTGEIVANPEQHGLTLKLYDGSIHESAPEHPERYVRTQFETLSVPVSLKFLNRAARKLATVKSDEMTVSELFRNRHLRSGRDATEMLFKLGERFALPFSCVTFALIGAPLGIRPHRSRRYHGLAVCFLLVILFYLALLTGELLAQQKVVPPGLGAWLPNLVFGAVGIILIRRSVNGFS